MSQALEQELEVHRLTENKHLCEQISQSKACNDISSEMSTLKLLVFFFSKKNYKLERKKEVATLTHQDPGPEESSLSVFIP